MSSKHFIVQQEKVSLRRKIRTTGWGILTAGWLAASVIFMYATNHIDTRDAHTVLNQQLYNFNLERIGGKSVVYAAKLNIWLASLWHGQSLAYTVAVISLLLALICFWVASDI